MWKPNLAACLALSMCLSLSTAAAPPPQIPILTVCEVLRNAADYEGKVLIVVGRVSETFEGGWISESCAAHITLDGKEWSPTISTAYDSDHSDPPPPIPKGFRWDRRILREKLNLVKNTTRLEVFPKYHYSDSWQAVYGRVNTRPQTWISGGARYTRKGFGHLGVAPAQIVWPNDRAWFRF